MPRGDRVLFLARRTLAAVVTTINTVEGFTLIADSGAERMVISRRAAGLLGLDLVRPLYFEPLVGIGGRVPVPGVRLDRVQVGATAVQGLLASVYDLPAVFRADGLLGLNFLSRFRVTFEFDTRTLVLREPPVRRP
ncbi:MAG: retroviral-like aspartic protease family protein [Chloroflexota bacterium]